MNILSPVADKQYNLEFSISAVRTMMFTLLSVFQPGETMTAIIM